MKKTIQLPTTLISTKIISAIFLLFSGILFAQTVRISGKVVDQNYNPIDSALVTDGTNTVYTNRNGMYNLNTAADQEVTVNFSKEKHVYYSKTVTTKKGRTMQLNCMLAPSQDEDFVQLDAAEITFHKQTPITSIELKPEDFMIGPSLNGGMDVLKTLPSVNSNNELSSQYMVRGGNYDENLIYVNGIEIYRPQLIRSGQQEGLSFVNPSMTQSVTFSAGGWEAKYGDKMSSVLDIIYKRPTKFEGSAELNTMGGNLTLGGASKDKKLSFIIGGRYLNRNWVLNTLDEDTDFNPSYYDAQANINYEFSKKFSVSFLGSLSKSRFKMEPKTKSTTIHTADSDIDIDVFYQGSHENDKFDSETGALTFLFRPNDKLDLTFDAFTYHSIEQEYYDMWGEYYMTETNSDGNPISTSEIGGQTDHARNNFDVLVVGAQHRGKYKINANNSVEWGLKYQNEDVRDVLSEFRFLDSAGYSMPNGNSDLVLDYSVKARNFLKSNRASGYLQYNAKMMWGNSKVLFNIGARATYWDFNDENNISPRAQIAIKPDWDETSMLFRFSTGLYYQPPFYREIRRLDGTLNDKVKSQQSIHFIAGNDYEFKMMERPFKLTTEIYYKILNDLNPYHVDNVRIRYSADNNSKGYAYGLDMRLFGEFVPGVESWFSASYARAYQNIDDRGNIPLPTDPRFKFSAFFQDYMPMWPSFKVNVNLIYASGLPNGSPQYADPYDFESTLGDYKRVDIGFVKEFINQKNLRAKGDFWKNFKELSLGLDIFNLFDIKNQISNNWIRNMNSNSVYAVPNYMTGRFLNARLMMKF